MKVSFNYIFYLLGYLLLLFNSNTYAKAVKSKNDQYYMIYVNNIYGEVEIYSDSDSKLKKRGESYNFVESLVEEIHSIIISNKDTYENPEKVEEIEQNSILSKRNDNENSSNFDSSDLIYPISSINNHLVLYGYLSEKVVKKISSLKYVEGCYPDSAKIHVSDASKEINWRVQDGAPLHLAAISRDPNENIYNNYYYPSSAGEDINIILVDTDFYFNYDEFKNTNRDAKCRAAIDRYGKIHESKSNNNYINCDDEKINHGKVSADIAGGYIYGAAKRSNIYGIRLEEVEEEDEDRKGERYLVSSSILTAMQYIYNNMITKNYKTVINLSLGGQFDTKNKKGDEAYYRQLNEIAEEITKNGNIIVASAGNEGMKIKKEEHLDQLILPCELDDVICVGGINASLMKRRGKIEFYEDTARSPSSLNYHGASNYGYGVDLYAPYVVNYITYDGKKGTGYGTSFSSPLVAGVIATIMSENPEYNWNKDRIFEMLYNSGISFYDDKDDKKNILVNNRNIDFSSLALTHNNWVEFNGSFPAHAVTLKNSNGDKLAVCHGKFKTYGVHPGYVYVNNSKRVCYISYGDNEYELTDFEILTDEENKFRWIEWNSSKSLHDYNFVQGGYESNNDPLYVCKVTHSNGNEYFGKTSTNIKGANYSYDGKECIQNQFYILVEDKSAPITINTKTIKTTTRTTTTTTTTTPTPTSKSNYSWVEFNGSIPAHAVTLKNSNGDKLAVCHGKFKTYGVHPGYVYVNNSKRVCYISYGDKEYELTDFEILTDEKNKFRWIEWDSSKSLQNYNFVQGGYESNNDPLYVCKVTHSNGNEYFGKTSTNIKGANYSYDGKECIQNQFYILVEDKSAPITINTKTIKTTTRTTTTTTTTTPTPTSKSNYSWVEFNGSIPAHAVTLKNSNGDKLAVCHGKFKTYGVHPGYVYVNNSKRVCYISYGDKEYELTDFEILTDEKNKFRWIEWDSSKSLQNYNFVQGGYESNNDPLYVCKVTHSNGNKYFGKTSTNIKGANYSYDGKECIQNQFYILVEDKSAPITINTKTVKTTTRTTTTTTTKTPTPTSKSNYSWVEFNGSIPAHAVTLKNSNGDKLAVCHGKFKTYGVHPGYVYVNNSKRVCYISYGDKEYELTDFEILTDEKNKFRWIEWDSSKSLQNYNFVQGGYESNNDPLYVCKVTHSNGNEYFGKTSTNIKGANYSYDGKECKQNQFYILVEDKSTSTSNYSWVEFNRSIPAHAVTLKNSNGDKLAVCHGKFKTYGVHPGYVYVNNSKRVCYIGYGDKEYELTDFEILTDEENKLRWIEWDSSKSLHNYNFVKGGYESNNDPLYVCKVTHSNGNEYFGKTSTNIKGANYSYDGKECKQNQFYILVE